MEEEWRKRIQQYRAIWRTEPELSLAADFLLMGELEHPEKNVLPIVTVFVTAPLLCAYIAWVVREAVRTGKKRLYFLARDGYYMKRVAELFCEAWGVDLECRYLYCSRYVWRGAVYHMDTEEALDYITLGGLEAGFQKMMQRAGLCEEESFKVAEQLGYMEDVRKRLSLEERKKLRENLSKCELFMQLLTQHSKEKYQTTLAYLRQEGLLDIVPYALVDSGWTGSLQKSLYLLLQSAGSKAKPDGYYFGMYTKGSEKEAGEYYTYYFSPENNIRRKVFFNNNVFECIYSAPHGMTTGYVEKEGIWQPVFEKEESPNKALLEAAEPLLMAYAGLYAVNYRNTVMSWSESYRLADLQQKNGVRRKGRVETPWEKQEQKRLERLLRLFMGKPTRREAQVYGSFVFCDDVIGEGKQMLAEKLDKEELKNVFLMGKLKNRFQKNVGRNAGQAVGLGRESAWPEGSVALVMGKTGCWHCAVCGYVRLTVETWRNRR